MLDEARRRPGQAVYPAAIPGYRHHRGPVLPPAPVLARPVQLAHAPVSAHEAIGRALTALIELGRELVREGARVLAPPVDRGCPQGHPDCRAWRLTSGQALRYHARVAGRQVAWQRIAARRALRRAVTVTAAVVLAAVAAAVVAGVTR
jgi:hypothetical protein